MKRNFCLPKCRLIWDRRGTCCSSGDVATVEMEIIYQRKRKWVSTGVRVGMREWDHARSRVKRRGDMLSLNERLGVMLDRMDALFAECQRRGVEFEFWMVDGAMKGKQADKVLDEGESGQWLGRSFVDWVDQRIKERKDLEESTLKTHTSMLNCLKQWGKIQKFADLTKPKILAWDGWLHAHDPKYTQATIYGYHKRLKRYVHEAVMMELLKDNPYNCIKIARGRTEGVMYLTKEELDKLRQVKLEYDKLDRVRDLFLFQCYTGLAYADLAAFDIGKCEMRDGRYWLRDHRVKSDEVYQILLLGPAVKILEKYEMRLPVISNQKYNSYLKDVQLVAGLKKPLRTHMARHTFAVMALNEGIQIETVAKMMGHTDIKTTQIYAKVLGKKVEDAYLELEKKVDEKNAKKVE